MTVLNKFLNICIYLYTIHIVYILTPSSDTLFLSFPRHRRAAPFHHLFWCPPHRLSYESRGLRRPSQYRCILITGHEVVVECSSSQLVIGLWSKLTFSFWNPRLSQVTWINISLTHTFFPHSLKLFKSMSKIHSVPRGFKSQVTVTKAFWSLSCSSSVRAPSESSFLTSEQTFCESFECGNNSKSA